MSVTGAIYKAPIIYCLSDEKNGTYSVNIQYDSRVFTGNAKLSENDKDFFSVIVGKTIALSKARIKAIKYEIKKSQNEFKYRNDFYQEVIKYGQESPAFVDPTGSFRKAIYRITERISSLQKALKQEKLNLKKYIENQEEALSIVKRFRKDNNN